MVDCSVTFCVIHVILTNLFLWLVWFLGLLWFIVVWQSPFSGIYMNYVISLNGDYLNHNKAHSAMISGTLHKSRMWKFMDVLCLQRNRFLIYVSNELIGPLLMISQLIKFTITWAALLGFMVLDCVLEISLYFWDNTRITLCDLLRNQE